MTNPRFSFLPEEKGDDDAVKNNKTWNHNLVEIYISQSFQEEKKTEKSAVGGDLIKSFEVRENGDVVIA